MLNQDMCEILQSDKKVLRTPTPERCSDNTCYILETSREEKLEYTGRRTYLVANEGEAVVVEGESM